MLSVISLARGRLGHPAHRLRDPDLRRRGARSPRPHRRELRPRADPLRSAWSPAIVAHPAVRRRRHRSCTASSTRSSSIGAWLRLVPVSYPATFMLGVCGAPDGRHHPVPALPALAAEAKPSSRSRSSCARAPMTTICSTRLRAALAQIGIEKVSVAEADGPKSWPMRTVAFAVKHLLGAVVRGKPIELDGRRPGDLRLRHQRLDPGPKEDVFRVARGDRARARLRRCVHHLERGGAGLRARAHRGASRPPTATVPGSSAASTRSRTQSTPPASTARSGTSSTVVASRWSWPLGQDAPIAPARHEAPQTAAHVGWRRCDGSAASASRCWCSSSSLVAWEPTAGRDPDRGDAAEHARRRAEAARPCSARRRSATSVEYRPGADGRRRPTWPSCGCRREHPRSARPEPILLVFGVNNLGRNHPAIVRVADALARTGVAVLVPDSRTLLEGRLRSVEIDGVVDAFETLAARPEVDPRARRHRRLQRRRLARAPRRRRSADRRPTCDG